MRSLGLKQRFKDVLEVPWAQKHNGTTIAKKSLDM